MKRNFLTGLAILLPMALTLWILSLLINILTSPFVGIIEYLVAVDVENFSQTAQDLLFFMSKIAILLLLVVFIIIVGYFAQHYFVRSFFRYSDLLLHRVPFVNKIYMAAQEVVKSLFNEQHTEFSQVVLVPFPNEKTRSIGFITRGDQTRFMESPNDKLVSVFVPGTPNPTMGFMLLFQRDTLIFTDMTIEEAFKFVISCGIMAGPFKPVEKLHPPS